ncbi:hypothetical protein CRYUN_Cryun23aG0070500 [Craigia yunnanensis]
MGDSEAVVADSSAIMDHTAVAYNSTGSGAYPSESTGEPTASSAPAYGNYYAPGGASNFAGQEGQISAMYDSKPAGGSTDENAADVGNTAVDASKATGYNSSLNGNVVNEAANVTTFVCQLMFTSTPCMQNNILKIRKVYDAFLADFPFCYGYWKKYADHEARIGSMDKVVEVYERAVQGVTYSVDIWGAILCICHRNIWRSRNHLKQFLAFMAERFDGNAL